DLARHPGAFSSRCRCRPRRPAARLAVHREREQRGPAVRLAQRQPPRQGRLPRVRRPRPYRGGEQGGPGDPGGGPLTPSTAGGGEVTLRLRLFSAEQAPAQPFADFEQVFADRLREAEEYYAQHLSPALTDEERRVMRQAYAGLLWSKQFYHYVVKDWLHGDPD